MEGLAWEAIFAAGTFFFLGAISPGPSVMVVIRNTIVGGRSQGVACAVGHGIGFGIYAISAVFGLIVLLENAPDVFLVLQLIGVGLLIWYGYLMWFDDVNLDEKGHTEFAKTSTDHKREKEQLKVQHDREKDRARERDTARKNIQTEAPSLAVLKKKIKSGTKLGSTETASAKARGLIPRADGTKRKSPKYK
mgnify:CR=1 FL=1